ncbi:hypothetical protein DL96DRAFT_1814068 [Flagelloscypha sp. PMI_526]|nr:hypothetical protein DL96DRAFT_1814068 [Flagelloscypha sp. PMI_526]
MSDFDPVAYINQLDLGLEDLAADDAAVNDATIEGLAADYLEDDVGSTDASGGQASAYVVGREVVSFSGNIRLQQRKDVINSFLLAQLAAIQRCPNDEDGQEYFNCYRNMLGQLGWDTTKMGITEVSNVASHGTVNVLVLDHLKEILQPEAFSLGEATINALNKPGRAISLLNKHARGRSQKSSIFNVSVCSEANNGKIKVNTSYYFYKTDRTIDNTLFFTLADPKVSFSDGSQEIQLDVWEHATREVLVAKLKTVAAQYVQKIFG